MFKELLSIFQIRKEIPDAVGYTTYGPVSFPIPEELISELDSPNFKTLRRITLLSLRIDNYSSKIQKNIRVLYSGGFSYSPKFEFNRRRSIQVKHKLIEEDKEVIVTELPPNESVFITIFNPFDDFKIEQVLLGEYEITKLMQKIVEAKRDPGLARMQLMTLALIPAMIFGLLFVGYLVREDKLERTFINSTYSNLGFEGCTPYLYNNPLGEEKALERKFKNTSQYWRRHIFLVNNVNSFGELKIKDTILWCEPKKS